MAFAVSNQVFDIGQSTPEAYGAWVFSADGGSDPILSIGNLSGAGAGDWDATYNSGDNSVTLAPSAAGAGALSSSYTLTLPTFDGAGQTGTQDDVTLSITGTAGYTAANWTEFEALAEDTGLALGETIWLRGNDFNDDFSGVSIKRTAEPTGTWNGSNYVVVRPHTGEVPKFWKLFISGQTSPNQYFKFQDFEIHAAENASFGSDQNLIDIFSGASYVYLQDLTYYATGATFDYGDFNFPGLIGAANSTNGNIKVVGLRATDVHFQSVNLTGPQCEIRGSYLRNIHNDVFVFGRDFNGARCWWNDVSDKKALSNGFDIAGVTNGNPTQVQVTDLTGFHNTNQALMVGNGTSQVSPAAINYIDYENEEVSFDYDSTGESLSGGNLEIGSASYSISSVVTGNPTVATLSAIGNGTGFIDHASYAQERVQSITYVDYNTSEIYVDYDSSGDSAWTSGGVLLHTTQHSDFLQFLTNVISSATEGSDVIVRGNLMARGRGSVGRLAGQGIFMNNNSGFVFDDWLVDGNIVVSDTFNGIYLDEVTNAIVGNNTVVAPRGQTSTFPSIQFIGTSSGCVSKNNISNNYGYNGQTNYNDRTITAGDNSAYDSVFKAPTGMDVLTNAINHYGTATDGPAAALDVIQGYATAYIDFTNQTVAYATDVTGPVVTSVSVNAVSHVSVSGQINVDDISSTVYAVLTTTTNTPSATQVVSGKDHNDVTAEYSESAAATSTSLDFTADGLTPSTAYRWHYVGQDEVNNYGAVVTSAEITTDASATVYEIYFGTGEYLDLATTVSDPSANGFTVACHIGSFATVQQYFLGRFFDIYVRHNTTGTLRFRLEDNSGSILHDTTTTQVYSATEDLAFAWGVDASNSKVVINGTTIINSSHTATAAIRMPQYFNDKQSGGNDAFDLKLTGGLWIAEDYVDPTVYATAFFTTDNQPHDALLDGTDVNGVSPSFFHAGSASTWNILDQMVGTVTDVDTSTTPANDSVSMAELTGGTPAFGSFTLSQDHALTISTLVLSAPTIASTTLSQEHAVAPSDVDTGTPVFGTFTLSFGNAVTIGDLTVGTPVFGLPGLVHENIGCVGVAAGVPEIGTPVPTELSQLDPDNRYIDVTVTLSVTYTDKIS